MTFNLQPTEIDKETKKKKTWTLHESVRKHMKRHSCLLSLTRGRFQRPLWHHKRASGFAHVHDNKTMYRTKKMDFSHWNALDKIVGKHFSVFKCIYFFIFTFEGDMFDSLRFYPDVQSVMSLVLSKAEQRINANPCIATLFFYPPFSHTKDWSRACEVALSHSPRLSSARKKRSKITMKIAADTPHTHTQADTKYICGSYAGTWIVQNTRW